MPSKYAALWEGRMTVMESLEPYIEDYFRQNGIDPKEHARAAKDYATWALSEHTSADDATALIQSYLERQVRIIKDARR